VMGKRYFVPEGVTILKALEMSGYKIIRGCGCRGGFCGACGTVYRLPGDHRLHVGLACQTSVEPGMTLTTLPFFPANKASYNLEETKDPKSELFKLYPEVLKCLGCSSCTKICPQDLDVMQYIQEAVRGNFKRCAELSFDCIMCGLCASRCTVQMVPYNIAEYVRRAYAKFELEKPEFLAKRIKEIEDGVHDKVLKELMQMDIDNLKKTYSDRDIEKLK